MMRRRAQAGFSLLELMVATVIAMASAVAIFQTMSVSEERRRSTTSGSEGLQSGVFGLAALERAVLSAGYNLTAISDTTYSSPVRRRVAMLSAERMARAMMVMVGFLCALEAKTEPSVR